MAQAGRLHRGWRDARPKLPSERIARPTIPYPDRPIKRRRCANGQRPTTTPQAYDTIWPEIPIWSSAQITGRSERKPYAGHAVRIDAEYPHIRPGLAHSPRRNSVQLTLPGKNRANISEPIEPFIGLGSNYLVTLPDWRTTSVRRKTQGSHWPTTTRLPRHIHGIQASLNGHRGTAEDTGHR